MELDSPPHLFTKPNAMSPNEITRSSLLDLLFEHRNKQYGAYVLRKYYGNRLSLSIGIMLGTVLLVLLLMNVLAGKPERGFLPPQKVIDIVLAQAPAKTPDPEPIKPARRSGAPVRTDVFTKPVITNGPTNMPPNDNFNTAAIGTVRSDGGPGDGPSIPAVEPGPPAPLPAPIETAPEPEGITSAPSFPGGMKAWTDFLVRHLVPSSDMQPGERRSVLVRFWVDEEGAVGRFEIVQSAGSAFDNEVLRVLRKMPRWKPALQRGRAVATSFVQPVTFQAPDE
ncbi:MAG: TonB family protein [Chitinophagaceae bacterium]|nr:MAG: TonB family protein [Chitinophagaceae bacterium]